MAAPRSLWRSLLDLLVLAVLFLAVCGAFYAAGYYARYGHWPAW